MTGHRVACGTVVLLPYTPRAARCRIAVALVRSPSSPPAVARGTGARARPVSRVAQRDHVAANDPVRGDLLLRTLHHTRSHRSCARGCIAGGSVGGVGGAWL